MALSPGEGKLGPLPKDILCLPLLPLLALFLVNQWVQVHQLGKLNKRTEKKLALELDMNLLYMKGMLQAIIELLLGEVKVVEKLEPDPLVVVIYLPPLCGAAGRDDGFLAVSASCLLRCYFNCTCTCLIT